MYTIANFYQDCSTQQLVYNDATAFEATVDSNGALHLLTTQQLLLASNEYEYSYEGVANVRGTEVDSWISLRDFEAYSPSVNLTNVIYEIFFTRPGFVLTSDYSVTVEPAIWQINIKGTANYFDSTTGEYNSTNFTSEFNWFNFSPDEPFLDVFDSSVCLEPSEFVIVNFAILTNDTLTTPPIRAGVRNAIVNYVQSIGMPFITPLQISAIQVYKTLACRQSCLVFMYSPPLS